MKRWTYCDAYTTQSIKFKNYKKQKKMRAEILKKIEEINKLTAQVKEMLAEHSESASVIESQAEDIFFALRRNSREFIRDAYKYYGLMPFSVNDRVLMDYRHKHRINNPGMILKTLEQRGVVRIERTGKRLHHYRFMRSIA